MTILTLQCRHRGRADFPAGSPCDLYLLRLLHYELVAGAVHLRPRFGYILRLVEKQLMPTLQKSTRQDTGLGLWLSSLR